MGAQGVCNGNTRCVQLEHKVCTMGTTGVICHFNSMNMEIWFTV